MILVNDLGEVRGIPAWAKHQVAEVPGITFVDLILPLFLFLLGLSVPLGLRARLGRAGRWAACWHVLRRSAGLLLAGVFLVNQSGLAEGPTGLRREWWEFLLVVALLGLLHQPGPASSPRRWLVHGARACCAALLLWLGLRYRGVGEGGQLVGLSPQWWGILGILGWAYLTTSLVYLCCGERALPPLLLLLVLVGLHLWERAHGPLLPGVLWGEVVTPALGPCDPIALAGLAAGLLWQRGRARRLVPLGLALAALGLWVSRLHPISKHTASPSYILLSAGLCALLYGPLRWLVGRRPRALAWLGREALLAYLLPTGLYAVINLYQRELLNLRFGEGAVGALRAAVVTAVVLLLTAGLSRAGLRVRL